MPEQKHIFISQENNTVQKGKRVLSMQCRMRGMEYVHTRYGVHAGCIDENNTGTEYTCTFS